LPPLAWFESGRLRKTVALREKAQASRSAGLYRQPVVKGSRHGALVRTSHGKRTSQLEHLQTCLLQLGSEQQTFIADQVV
jgi:hypothetical protein